VREFATAFVLILAFVAIMWWIATLDPVVHKIPNICRFLCTTLSAMFIRWQKRERWGWGRNKPVDVHWGAVLIQAVRVDGKPRQRHVAYLGSFTERGIESVHQRGWFWDRVTARLDAPSNRLTDEDRNRIITELAAKVLVPTRQEYAKSP
jgi:hypothetical protein